LIISFDTRALRDQCASLEMAEAAFGSAHASELIAALADAEAAEHAAEFMELYPGGVTTTNERFSVPIGTEYRTAFQALGVTIVRSSKGTLDWQTVRRLKMMDLSRC
jgi:hypothetical protein